VPLVGAYEDENRDVDEGVDGEETEEAGFFSYPTCVEDVALTFWTRRRKH